VKDRETAEAFRQLFVKCQSEYKKGAAPATTVPSGAAAAAGDASVKAGAAATTWRCDICKVELPLDKMKCGACGTVKPGSVPSADEAKKVPARASMFSFGGPAAAGGKAFPAKPSSAKTTVAFGASQPAAGKFSFVQPTAAAAASPTLRVPTCGVTLPAGSGGSDAAADPSKPKPSIFGQSKAAATPAASATSPRSPSGVKDDMTALAIAEALLSRRAQAKQTTATASDHAAEPPKPASIFGQSKGGAASAAPQAQAQPKLSFSFGKPAAVVSGAPTLSGIGGPSTATTSGPASPAGGGLKFAFGQSKGGFSSQAGVAAASAASPTQPKLSFSFGAKPGAGAAPKAADGSGDDAGEDDSDEGDDDDEDNEDEDDEGDEDEDEDEDEE
jgi:hypothetical protein